jgi:kynurenine formamidase
LSRRPRGFPRANASRDSEGSEAGRRIELTGADTWAVEAVPGEGEQPFECHIKLQTKRGIWNIEILDLRQLVADKAYEFLFTWAPLKMRGATGSPGNPLSIY